MIIQNIKICKCSPKFWRCKICCKWLHCVIKKS